MSTIGERIREARNDKGLSQEELAKILNTSKATISRYENGSREPRFDMLGEIAGALNISPFVLMSDNQKDFFFSGYNDAISTKRYRDAETEEEKDDAEDAVLDLLHFFDELDAHGQERAVACVRALAGHPLIIGQEPNPEEVLITILQSLNKDGRIKAVERMEELSEIPKYQREK